MGFLNPIFLAAAAAVAVPVLVHLLHLRSGRRRPFPALRYLRRTEREHARRIRLRQILLLIARTIVVLLLVAAGARLFLQGGGSDHEPTALAVVLDNSLSTGVVVEDERLLDALKRTALASVETATPDDRIWVLRAGEPWSTPVPESRPGARRRIQATEPGGTVASLPEAVARARSLVASAGMPAAEVHVLSDLQATAFPDSVGADDAPGNGVPVLVFEPADTVPPNRYVASVDVGGGLPPLRNQSTRIDARVETAGGGAVETDTARIRLVLDGRLTAVADAPIGTTVLMSAGPFALAEVSGAVEVDPDALRIDDRRYFAFRVRPPPRVATGGEVGIFLSEALTVLTEADRIRRAEPADADVLITAGGEGLERADSAAPAIFLPPDDPAVLPAANRRLREAGVRWRLEAGPEEGETTVQPSGLPLELEEVRVRRAYRLLPADDDAAAGGSVRARRSSGEPWIVDTRSGDGRPVLLLGSPLRPEATSLPVSSEMLPLVEWMVSGWPPTFRTAVASDVGEPLRVTGRATEIRSPDGTLHRVDGRQPFRDTGSPGIYEVLEDDSVVARRAVNPPTSESLLRRLDAAEAAGRIPGPAQTVSGSEDWTSRIFLQRRGGEPWRILLLAALALLIGEGLLAAGGPRGRKSERETGARVSPTTETDRADVP